MRFITSSRGEVNGNNEERYSKATRQIGIAFAVISFAFAVYFSATKNADAMRLALGINGMAAAATFAFFGCTIRNTPAGQKALLIVFAYMLLANIAVKARGYLVAIAT